MSITDDQRELEKINRKAAIKKALEVAEPASTVAKEGDEPLNWSADEAKTYQDEPKAQPKAAYCGRPLYPWEVLVKNRPVQFRPMASREVEAMDEKTMLDNIRRQDEANELRVQAAIRERDKEQADIDKRRAHEEKTGKRPYGEKRFISLDQARREGYLQSENASNGKPEWWSPGNPDGMFAGGR